MACRFSTIVNAYEFDSSLRRHSGFYQYYQIGEKNDTDTTENGSKKSGELKQFGLHSPWGSLFEIVRETGWTLHYVLWKVSRANIHLMMADRSRWETIKNDTEAPIQETGKQRAARKRAKIKQ